MPKKAPYKRTVKMWEYRPSVADTMRRDIPNPWGYASELISFIAYQYTNREDVVVTFHRANIIGRMITVVAPVHVWDQAQIEMNNPYKKEA